MLNRALPLLLLVALLCPAEDASGWQALEQLKPGTVLRIGTPPRQYCRLIRVTDSTLECAQLLRTRERLVVFQRREIHQIRLAIRKPTHQLRNTLIGAAAGEALGIVWAHATAGSDPIGSDPAVLAVAGLPGAALLGALAHTFSDGNAFRDGPIIYSASGNP
jgi:hypothetical protein